MKNILYVSNRVKIYELLVHLLILNGEGRVAVISWLLSWHPAIWQSLCCSSRTWASSVHTRASNETQWFDLKVEHPDSSPINGRQSDRPHRLYSSSKYRGKKGYEKYDISVLWMYICTYEAYLLWYSFVGHVYCYQEILRMFSIVWICVTSGSLWNIKNDALFVWYRSHISDTHFSFSPWARSMKLVHRYHFRWQIPPYIFWKVRLSTFWKSLGAMSKK